MGFYIGLVGADKNPNAPHTPTDTRLDTPRSPSNESDIHNQPSYIHMGATITPRESTQILDRQSRHTDLIAQPSLQLRPGDFTVHANPSYEFWFDALEYQVRGNSPSMSNIMLSSSPELITYPELGETIKQPCVAPFRDSDLTKAIRDWEREALKYPGEPISNRQSPKRTKASSSMRSHPVSLGDSVNIPTSSYFLAENPPSSLFLEGYYLMHECQQIIKKLEAIIDRFDLELESSKAANPPTRAPLLFPSSSRYNTRHRAFDPPYPLTPDHLKSLHLEDNCYDDDYIPRYPSGNSTHPTEAKRYPPLWGSHDDEKTYGQQQQQQQQREEAPFFDQDYYDRLSPSTNHISPLTLQIPLTKKEASPVYSPSLFSPTASHEQESRGGESREWLSPTSPFLVRRFHDSLQYSEESENHPFCEKDDEDDEDDDDGDASSSEFIDSPPTAPRRARAGDKRRAKPLPVTSHHGKQPCTRCETLHTSTASSIDESSSQEYIRPQLRSTHRRRDTHGFALDAWASNLLNAEEVRDWAEVKRQVWRARKWDFKQGVRSWIRRGTKRRRYESIGPTVFKEEKTFR